MAKPGFKYRGSERTAEDISRKASEGSRMYDSYLKPGTPMFKPKEGENTIRILPSTWEEPDWDYTIQSHYGVGPDNARYLCLKMKNEDCPVCEAKINAADKEEADQLTPSKGAICWVIDRDNEKAGPQLWAIPFSKVRNEIYSRSTDKKTRAPILVDDPEEGYDITFIRSGTGLKTEYKGVEVSRDPTPLHDDQKLQGRWLEYIEDHPLPDLLNFYDADHIQKVLFGKAAPKAAEDYEEAPVERPARASRKPVEEPDEDEEAEAAETPRNARAGRSTARRPVEEEVEEEVVEETPVRSRRRALLDEEEEEPAPTTRKRAAAAPEEDEEEPSPVRAAKASLERLKTRHSR